MHSTLLLPLLFVLAHAQQQSATSSAAPSATPKHGEGEEGSSMGPVAFLWPSDRQWTAANDNIAPCGSPSGPGNRTKFPLSQGSVALTIADEAWNVAFRIAYDNNPTQQAQFEDQVISNVSEVEAGHQCYKLGQLDPVSIGTNATIQLEYWSEFEGENSGNNQSFFACADVTFVEAKDFSVQVPCFNVTSGDFNAPMPSSGAGPSSTGASPVENTAPPSKTSSSASSSGGGLSSGDKAGIAVGSIIGGLLLAGAVAFVVYRRGKSTGLQHRESYELRAKKLGADHETASGTSAQV